MKKKTTPEPPVSSSPELLCPDNHHEAIISMNNSLDVKSWNKGAERIYGIEKNEAIGQSLTSLVLFALIAESPASLLEKLFRHGHWQGKKMYIRKDRIVIFTDVTINAVKDPLGMTIGHVAIIREETMEDAYQKEFKPIFDPEYRFVGLVSADAPHAWEMVLHWEE